MNKLIYHTTELRNVVPHLACCISGWTWTALPDGTHLAFLAPRHHGVKPHLASGGTFLPAAHNPCLLTADEAAIFPAEWGITTSDTMFSALNKAYTATGNSVFDPEI